MRYHKQANTPRLHLIVDVSRMRTKSLNLVGGAIVADMSQVRSLDLPREGNETVKDIA